MKTYIFIHKHSGILSHYTVDADDRETAWKIANKLWPGMWDYNMVECPFTQ